MTPKTKGIRPEQTVDRPCYIQGAGSMDRGDRATGGSKTSWPAFFLFLDELDTLVDTIV